MRLFSIFCACIVLFFSTSVWAAKFHLDAQVVEAFSADGLFTPIPLPDYTRPVGYPAVYKIDYSIVANTAEFAPTDSFFVAAGFAINQNQGISDDFDLGWNPSTAMVDINGGAPGGIVPFFHENQDLGESTKDLYGIFVAIVPNVSVAPPNDPRFDVGKYGPTYIGSTYLVWDGVSLSKSSISSLKAFVGVVEETVEVLIRKTDGSVYDDNFPATTLYFGTIPEPAGAVLLLGFTVIGLFRRSFAR
jgi:hypothetical protein